MKKMIIFEPAMCCPTGVCGPGVDKNLLRISTVINNLKSNGIVVERYNLSNNPQKFLENSEINKIISNDGVDSLPVTMVDEVIVKMKDYPSNEEFCKLLDISPENLKPTDKKDSNGCGCGDGCC
ncbi:arsenite efflux transporter metallochaperone ArsD [Clostridium sp. D2Q-11]|uniref:Arsenite efflux transporter metallochaperone ArsD n=1 Tax=Anaeromonas frigoriresistens TaxID=2683708 RepID=A0A942Z961_9FIRM|nr:arsenite efflux transporter metallochaperone ArsD [Anaeromonas frigoriresistens]MBS4538988.1 arsenite efflux transporter metallochaperone ArsD [Anaeromonas frigoriresistens]